MHLLQVNNQPLDWRLFFGHFHPVVVHLPIGILVIAFILELVRLKTKNNLLNAPIAIVLFYGFISAIVSCLFGWLLSSAGDYDENTLLWHQWMGVSVAILSGLLWLGKKKKLSFSATLFPKIYTCMLVLMVLLITFTGHLGGSMTHGNGYLTADMPQPFRQWLGIQNKENKNARKPITDINEALIYADCIAPVMEAKCWTCHNATKKKGKLRMDTEDLLMKGGKHGVVIKANDAEGSEIIKRITLPEGDNKRMPPEGKSGLTEQEVGLIKWWIAGGASFTAKVKQLPQSEIVKAYFKKMSTAIAGNNSKDNGIDTFGGTPVSPVFLQKISFAAKADIDALKSQQVIISPVSQNQSFLELSMINNASFDDANMKLLNKISPQIAWLKLSGTKISDAGIKEINACKNLVRLNIEGTFVTNNSIATLKQLPNLEYLNIVGTKIDNNGLAELASIKLLKNIYCWQTGVTQKGVDDLHKLNPGIIVNFGGDIEGKK